MTEIPKTKSDGVGVGCDDLLAQKRLQLKAARRESKKAAMQGRHNWGDFHRNQHIKYLEREIQILRANTKRCDYVDASCLGPVEPLPDWMTKEIKS